MSIIVELDKMVAELWRLRNAYFDNFDVPGHAEREAELRQFLWDNKTGICAVLSHALRSGDRTAIQHESRSSPEPTPAQ